jgi:hypothetical protein
MHVRLSQARLFANLMFARNRLAGCLAAALTVLLPRCKDKGYLVRAGSTQHREPPGPRRARAVMAGMQDAQVTWHPPPRPPTAKLHGTGFKSLTQLPRALRALAHEVGVIEDGPHPSVRVEPTAQPDTGVVRAGCRQLARLGHRSPPGTQRMADDVLERIQNHRDVLIGPLQGSRPPGMPVPIRSLAEAGFPIRPHWCSAHRQRDWDALMKVFGACPVNCLEVAFHGRW